MILIYDWRKDRSYSWNNDVFLFVLSVICLDFIFYFWVKFEIVSVVKGREGGVNDVVLFVNYDCIEG